MQGRKQPWKWDFSQWNKPWRGIEVSFFRKRRRNHSQRIWLCHDVQWQHRVCDITTTKKYSWLSGHDDWEWREAHNSRFVRVNILAVPKATTNVKQIFKTRDRKNREYLLLEFRTRIEVNHCINSFKVRSDHKYSVISRILNLKIRHQKFLLPPLHRRRHPLHPKTRAHKRTPQH